MTFHELEHHVDKHGMLETLRMLGDICNLKVDLFVNGWSCNEENPQLARWRLYSQKIDEIIAKVEEE